MTIQAGRLPAPGRNQGPPRLDARAGDLPAPGQRRTGGFPVGLAAVLRPGVASLVERTVTQIQGQVGAYAGSPRGRRRRLIEAAVSGAVRHFVDSLEGRHQGRVQVDDLFRRMGRGEALDGNSLAAIREALDIATRDAWHTLRVVAVDAGLSTAELGQLGDRLFALIDHLGDQVSVGYHAAREEIGQATHRARSELLTALLGDSADDEVAVLASLAGWPLASRYVVVTADTTSKTAAREPVLIESRLLISLRPPVSIGVVPLLDHDDIESVTELVEELRALPEVGRVALSWPVARDELPDAVRWGRRALHLSHQGVLPADDVLLCHEHTTALWLHAEPLLCRQVTRHLLQPLLRETPHSRAVLSRTLLAWLSTHDSAPVLAARLGVHAQTVRYRMRRLRELLGSQLDDPDAALAMKLALETGMPLWAAGHGAVDIADAQRSAGRPVGAEGIEPPTTSL